jgi:hypothetical protein
VIRGIVLAAVLVAVPARADEVSLPSIVTNCHGPSGWDDVVACVRRQRGGYTVPDKPDGRLGFASVGKRERYLYYQAPDGQWLLATRIYDDGFAIEQPRTVRIGGRDGVWIDMHHVDSNGIDVVVQRSALVCPWNRSCSQLMYECRHFSRGHSRETFLGTIKIDGANIQVTGDRTQAGFRC